jgi:DNA-binding transcriptional ArsR family regulator
MQELLHIDRIEQAEALLKPRRVEILRRLAEPSTCTQIGKQLGDSPQKVYYHVKQLQTAGLVELVDERRVRGITEGIYRAVAHSYWVSPELIGRIGPPRESNQFGLGFLLTLSEGLQTDLADLAAQEGSPPTLGISGEVRLRADQGAAFVEDLENAFQSVLDRYSGTEGTPFRLALACYPMPAEDK